MPSYVPEPPLAAEQVRTRFSLKINEKSWIFGSFMISQGFLGNLGVDLIPPKLCAGPVRTIGPAQEAKSGGLGSRKTFGGGCHFPTMVGKSGKSRKSMDFHAKIIDFQNKAKRL